MFYIPGDDYRSERWCVSGPAYEPYKEAASQPCYEVTRKELVRSEGLSLQLACSLEKSFATRGLLLHPYTPTRNHVVRGKRSWVPAVLRNTIVPCAVLIEVCNLANKKDAELIAKPAYRQAVADAYIAALVKYYS
jgi:N-acetylmuramoyl-L-alanine amidase